MSSAAQQAHIEHPIDLIEGLAASREWPFERGTEDDMNVCVSGCIAIIIWRLAGAPIWAACIWPACSTRARPKANAMMCMNCWLSLMNSFGSAILTFGRAMARFCSAYHVCQR